MRNQPGFDSIEELENSQWLQEIKTTMKGGEWPSECESCKILEENNQVSPRQKELPHAENLVVNYPNYLNVSINIGQTCNAACQICSSKQSSLIAKLEGTYKPSVAYIPQLSSLPLHRMRRLFLTGGEPSIYAGLDDLIIEIIKNNIERVFINTNGSVFISGVRKLLDAGINVTLSISMDGQGLVFEYCRWPITWDKFSATVSRYLDLSSAYSNLTLVVHHSVSSLSLPSYLEQKKLVNEWGVTYSVDFVMLPKVVAVSQTNFLTLSSKQSIIDNGDEKDKEFARYIATSPVANDQELIRSIATNDVVRNISFNDYFEHRINFSKL